MPTSTRWMLCLPRKELDLPFGEGDLVPGCKFPDQAPAQEIARPVIEEGQRDQGGKAGEQAGEDQLAQIGIVRVMYQIIEAYGFGKSG